MSYVRVLFAVCLLSTCGSVKTTKQPVTHMITTELELADAREMAASHIANLRIERQRSIVLREQINMLEFQAKQQLKKLGECNTLNSAYESAILMGDEIYELEQDQEDQQ